MSCHHHDAGLRQLRSEHARDRGASEGRHVLVDERHVWTEPPEELKRKIAVAGLAYDVDRRIGSEAHPQRATKLGIAVADQQADR